MNSDTALRLRVDGHRWKRLIGLPFFMFGVMALWLIPQVDDPDALLWVGFLSLATGFAAAGGFILFASFETEVDRAAGSVSDVTKLFRFIWHKRREIGDASRVELRAEDRMNTSADDFDSRTYRVWLRGPGNDDPGIPVISEIKYPAARAHAVATAEYLALPLEDYTAAEPRGDAERRISPPRKPPGVRFLREEESDSATLRLATPGFRGVHCFYLSVAFAFPLGVHFFAASNAGLHWGDPGDLVPLLMFHGIFSATPCLMCAPPALRSLSESLRMRFESDRFTIRRRWLFGWSNRSIRYSEVDRVDLAASSRCVREPGLHGSVVRVIVRGGGVVELGTMLTRAEAAWLRDEILRNADRARP